MKSLSFFPVEDLRLVDLNGLKKYLIDVRWFDGDEENKILVLCEFIKWTYSYEHRVQFTGTVVY